MNKIFTIISAVALCTATAMAQPTAAALLSQGSSAQEIVPSGWQYTHTTGDLNNDGIDDLVLIAIPNDTANMTVREDGYVFNFNTPLLAINW